jgi:tetratricopeptide (TPR) repeat protein
MKMKKIFLIIILQLSWFVGFAQDELMSGFKMLETGKFAEGATFFKHYLDTKDAKNKTALLCYGRGIGLSGNVPEAKQVFNNLLERFPSDFEVSLNAAEAFMWAKEYKDAKVAYEKLLLMKPNDFAANLGYANANASLFDYKKALEFTNKALIIDPKNESAKVSRKYARLGFADQYSKNQEYTPAGALLEDILKDFPNDKEALSAKAQLKVVLEKYDDAEKLYKSLLEITKGQTDVFLSLSYLSFLQKNKSVAMSYAIKAIESTKKQPENKLKAYLGKVMALGWNEKFHQAFDLLDSLERVFPANKNDVLIKKATLNTWNKDYALSADVFKKVLEKVPSSFDANLGCADALFAQELDVESKTYVMKTLKYYTNQKDAKDFLVKLSLRHSPSITTHDFISSDKGGNASKNYQLGLAFDIIPSFRVLLNYKSRLAENSIENNNAQTNNFGAGFRWRIKPTWLMTTGVSVASLTGKNNSKVHVLYDFANEFNLTKAQTLELRYQTDIQNFTAGLIDNNLSFQNFIATYSLNTPMKVGVYSQYYFTKNSDGNSRNLLFASLYYDLKAAPVMKAGVNFNTMSFQKQVPLTYFSPSQFYSYEAFGLVENLQVPKQKLLYQLSLAGGYQKIEKNDFQSTYRITVALGYRPKNYFEALVYMLNSNSATSSVVGYSYSETGIKAKLILLKK